VLRRAKADKAKGGSQVSRHGLVVVSDDKDACELMARLLEREGHEVDRLFSESSVLPALLEQPREAVLVSFSGGSSTNLKLVDSVRNHTDAAVKETPIVLVTIDEKNRVYSWQSGVDGFLVRPFHANELVRTMAETLARAPDERASHRRAELKKAQTPDRDAVET
jgi:DNA-binding response OmpR family regulator